MISGVNDRDQDARELAALCRRLRPSAHVNLIPLNPTPGYPTTGHLDAPRARVPRPAGVARRQRHRAPEPRHRHRRRLRPTRRRPTRHHEDFAAARATNRVLQARRASVEAKRRRRAREAQASSSAASRSPNRSAAGIQHREIGVDGDAAAGVDLEVQVGDADGVARVADVADDLPLLDPARHTLERREVGVVVPGPVVAEELDGVATKAG